MTDEETYFSSDGVRVTNARFIVHGETYSMANVTSVKTGRSDPSRKGPLVTSGIGVFALLAGSESGAGIVLGLALIGAGIWWWQQQSPTYSVLLSSASGEVRALSSRNEELVQKVVESINQAIVARG